MNAAEPASKRTQGIRNKLVPVDGGTFVADTSDAALQTTAPEAIQHANLSSGTKSLLVQISYTINNAADAKPQPKPENTEIVHRFSKEASVTGGTKGALSRELPRPNN